MQFIVLALNDWQGQWMNRQQLFSRIGQSHTVVYSNGPLMSWQFKASKRALFSAQLTHTDNVLVYTPPRLVTRFLKLPIWDRWIKTYFAKKIRNLLNPDEPVCLYIFHPSFADYVSCIPHDKLVYHAYDDFSKGGSYSAVVEGERVLARKSDCVFASSRLITERLSELGQRSDVHFIPNGVDYDAFQKKQPLPADLECISEPRVGYTGSINLKFDFPLIAELATKLPQVNFCLIGPVMHTGLSEEQLDDITSQSNIHLLGIKPLSEIAAYMQNMDINIMCYTTDKSVWASSGYPLKLHEYLAVGKPVISCDIEAVREFSDVVDIATTNNEWLELIEKNLIESQVTIAERQRVAQLNTWDQRVKVLLEALS